VIWDKIESLMPALAYLFYKDDVIIDGKHCTEKNF
jgi:hypothetical protein